MFKKGISLISLMVVIIVLGILAVVAIPNIKDIADNTRLSATLENKTNVQKAVDRYLLEKQEFPVETPGDLKIGEPQQVKWELLSPDYLREKPADLDRIYYWVDYNGSVFASDVDAPQNITINTVLGTTTITWDEVDGAKSYEVGYIDNSLVSQGLSRDLKALNASTSGYKVLGIVNSEDTLSFDATEDLTGKTVVLISVSENFKSVPVKVGYIGSELEAVEDENVPSGPQPLQTEVPDGWIGVYTIDDLKNMSPSKQYILMKNLDFNSDDSYEDIVLKTTVTTGAGWSPKYAPKKFDGNGLSISNLFINRPDAFELGLFSVIASDTVVENLTLIDSDITGKVQVGTLAGKLAGKFVYIKKIGIINSTINSSLYTGGLIGDFDSSAYTHYDSYVSESYVKNSNIQLNYIASHYSGGFIGRIRDVGNNAYMQNNYVENTIVYGNKDFLGGFSSKDGNVNIKNNYVSALVKNNVAQVYVGPVYGDSYSYNTYFNNDLTQVHSRNKGETPKTTSEMMQQSTYEGFDFDTIWSIDEGNDYPRLQWEN